MPRLSGFQNQNILYTRLLLQVNSKFHTKQKRLETGTGIRCTFESFSKISCVSRQVCLPSNKRVCDDFLKLALKICKKMLVVAHFRGPLQRVFGVKFEQKMEVVSVHTEKSFGQILLNEKVACIPIQFQTSFVDDVFSKKIPKLVNETLAF